MVLTFNTPSHWIGRGIKILVIGAGGSGSQLVTELAQMDFLLREVSNGMTHLDVTVADGDTVSQFNIGRQPFYLVDQGLNKSEILVHRFNTYNGTHWKAVPQYLTASDLDYKSQDFQIIITAVDKARLRYEIGKRFSDVHRDCLWLDLGNGQDEGQVIIGHLAKARDNQLRLPNVYDLYGEQLNQPELDDLPSCSTEAALQKQNFGVNRAVVAQATQLIWQLIRNGQISHHGAYVDVKGATVNPLLIDPDVWAVYGYKSEGWTQDSESEDDDNVRATA